MQQQATASRRYLHAHEAVIGNEDWYLDGPPRLSASFSAAKTAERQAEVVDLLEKAANKSKATGDPLKLSRQLKKLVNKIDRCRRGDRCGSLACPQCARAFQRAKAAAQEQLIKQTAKKSQPKPNSAKNSADGKSKPKKILVMATVIPLQLRYTPVDLPQLDIAKRTRWLKDVLTKAGLVQMMVGSADVGWEYRGNKHYYQLHWHLALWTRNPETLQKQLLRWFPPKKKYDGPVEISKSFKPRLPALPEQGDQTPRPPATKPAAPTTAPSSTGSHGSPGSDGGLRLAAQCSVRPTGATPIGAMRAKSQRAAVVSKNMQKVLKDASGGRLNT